MSEGLQSLSDGQKSCLRLVARGMSSKEIAKETGLAPQTVDTYLKLAMARIGAGNRRDAARALLEWEQSQNLGSPSPAVAAPRQAEDERPRSGKEAAGSWLRLPPLGGSLNDASWTQKTFQALSVAAISAAVVIGLALAIAGLLNTFR